jgi:hypothetical protein
MAKRVAGLTPPGDASSPEDRSSLRAACTLALYLVDWDLKGSAPALRRLTQRCREIVAAGASARFHPTPWLGRYIAAFTVHRARAGEKKALEEYAAWIRGVSPPHVTDSVETVFEPLWEYPRHKAIKKAAEWLFNDSASPWHLVIDPLQERGGYHTSKLLATRLIEVPAFRKQILRALTDTREGGYITVRSSGRVDVKVRGGWSTNGPPMDHHTPPSGTTAPFRVCDIYASQISRAHKEAPKCPLHWPVKERDKAVRASKAYIKSYDKERQ